MRELRLPKRRVAVELVQASGMARKVAVFLAQGAADHDGPERLSDLLNGTKDFLPALDEETQALTFINRRAVALARLPHEADAGAAVATTIPVEHELEIALTGGVRLNGVVSFVRPPESGRVLDFLNEPSLFFPLLQNDATVWVSRDHVLDVTLARG